VKPKQEGKQKSEKPKGKKEETKQMESAAVAAQEPEKQAEKVPERLAAEDREKQQGQGGRNKPKKLAEEHKVEEPESDKESQGQEAEQGGDADKEKTARRLFQTQEEIEHERMELRAGVASKPSQHDIDNHSDSDVSEVPERTKTPRLIGKKDKNNNTNEDEADESQAQMHTMDEDLVQKSAEEQQEIDVKVHAKLVKVSDMVMELINMGQGEVDEQYPMILQSIKNMSTTLAVITGLQQRLMAANSLLSIAKQEDGTYDIGKVLLELQNFMVKITEGDDGLGLMSVNYVGDQIYGDFNVIQRIYGYLENVLAGMAMMTELELSMSALRYEQRDGQHIVFQEPSIRSNKKMCIWKAKEEQQSSEKGTKRKRTANSPTNPPQQSETQVFKTPPKSQKVKKKQTRSSQ
jgi:hypothetical protein